MSFTGGFEYPFLTNWLPLRHTAAAVAAAAADIFNYGSKRKGGEMDRGEEKKMGRREGVGLCQFFFSFAGLC